MPPKNGISKQEDTVRRIIAGATKVFAASGFSGASVDEIAAAAGVNKATIYYHVGDKEALYGAVLHDVIGNTVARVAANLSEEQPPEEKLATYIRGIAATVEDYPPLPPVMMRAVESGGRNLPQEVATDLVLIFGMLMAILEEGEEKGVFMQANPFVVYLMILGALAFHRNVEATWDEQKELFAMLKELDQGLYAKLEQMVKGNVAEEVVRMVLKSVSAE